MEEHQSHPVTLVYYCNSGTAAGDHIQPNQVIHVRPLGPMPWSTPPHSSPLTTITINPQCGLQNPSPAQNIQTNPLLLPQYYNSMQPPNENPIIIVRNTNNYVHESSTYFHVKYPITEVTLIPSTEVPRESEPNPTQQTNTTTNAMAKGQTKTSNPNPNKTYANKRKKVHFDKANEAKANLKGNHTKEATRPPIEILSVQNFKPMSDSTSNNNPVSVIKQHTILGNHVPENLVSNNCNQYTDIGGDCVISKIDNDICPLYDNFVNDTLSAATLIKNEITIDQQEKEENNITNQSEMSPENPQDRINKKRKRSEESSFGDEKKIKQDTTVFILPKSKANEDKHPIDATVKPKIIINEIEKEDNILETSCILQNCSEQKVDGKELMIPRTEKTAQEEQVTCNNAEDVINVKEECNKEEINNNNTIGNYGLRSSKGWIIMEKRKEQDSDKTSPVECSVQESPVSIDNSNVTVKKKDNFNFPQNNDIIERKETEDGVQEMKTNKYNVDEKEIRLTKCNKKNYIDKAEKRFTRANKKRAIRVKDDKAEKRFTRANKKRAIRVKDTKADKNKVIDVPETEANKQNVLNMAESKDTKALKKSFVHVETRRTRSNKKNAIDVEVDFKAKKKKLFNTTETKENISNKNKVILITETKKNAHVVEVKTKKNDGVAQNNLTITLEEKESQAFNNVLSHQSDPPFYGFSREVIQQSTVSWYFKTVADKENVKAEKNYNKANNKNVVEVTETVANKKNVEAEKRENKVIHNVVEVSRTVANKKNVEAERRENKANNKNVVEVTKTVANKKNVEAEKRENKVIHNVVEVSKTVANKKNVEAEKIENKVNNKNVVKVTKTVANKKNVEAEKRENKFIHNVVEVTKTVANKKNVEAEKRENKFIHNVVEVTKTVANKKNVEAEKIENKFIHNVVEVTKTVANKKNVEAEKRENKVNNKNVVEVTKLRTTTKTVTNKKNVEAEKRENKVIHNVVEVSKTVANKKNVEAEKRENKANNKNVVEVTKSVANKKNVEAEKRENKVIHNVVEVSKTVANKKNVEAEKIENKVNNKNVDKNTVIDLTGTRETEVDDVANDNGQSGLPFCGFSSEAIQQWTIDQLADYLNCYGWEQTSNIARYQEIDGESLFLCTPRHLVQVGIDRARANLICVMLLLVLHNYI